MEKIFTTQRIPKKELLNPTRVLYPTRTTRKKGFNFWTLLLFGYVDTKILLVTFIVNSTNNIYIYIYIYIKWKFVIYLLYPFLIVVVEEAHGCLNDKWVKDQMFLVSKPVVFYVGFKTHDILREFWNPWYFMDVIKSMLFYGGF